MLWWKYIPLDETAWKKTKNPLMETTLKSIIYRLFWYLVNMGEKGSQIKFLRSIWWKKIMKNYNRLIKIIALHLFQMWYGAGQSVVKRRLSNGHFWGHFISLHMSIWANWNKIECDNKIKQVFFVSNWREPSVNRKDLWALTLVGPPWTRPQSCTTTRQLYWLNYWHNLDNKWYKQFYV